MNLVETLQKRTFQTYFINSFSRANLTAAAATFVDFATLYFLVEYVGLYYVLGVVIGATTGAITNFTLNKYWAFPPTNKQLPIQGLQYAVVSAGSLLLNTLLVFLFTELMHLRYLVSKVIVALVVGWGWNYPLHKYYVFRKSR